MKRIAVVGLYAIDNAGDNILCETTQYLLREELPDVRIVEVDVNPRIGSISGLRKIPFLISKVLIKISSYLFKYENSSSFRYHYEYFMWWLKVNALFRKKLADVDAIVFAGGGFLKFRTQGLNYYVEQIVKIAEKRRVPVMMNGVGIEGYNEEDIRCQRLKRAINRDCMKVITTRDDITLLRERYITNPRILISRVGDPALWCPECYTVAKPRGDRNTIGINVIRGQVYRAYGKNLSEEDLKELYLELIRGMEGRGLNWILFSNGMKEDLKFGRELLAQLGRGTEKMIPGPKDSREFLETVVSFKCVFGARLHACITAYALDIPVVGLIWNEKLRFFADIIGKKKAFFEEDELCAEKIIDAIERESASSYDGKIRSDLRELTRHYIRTFIADNVTIEQTTERRL